ncbi:MAG: MEKHLA domain-containing protein [Gammaproteobacteria bacterium]|nr:MEKHLA domain-containing protein [Gammaproteobacteria bacterium]
MLTGLALYWLWRQRIPKTDKQKAKSIETGREPGMPAPLPAPDESNEYHAGHAALLITSHRHWTGRDLIKPGESMPDQARELYQAPFVVASHGCENDPVFNYANRAALALFETGWAEFTSMPSRLSAEPMEREARARLLERVNRDGFIDDYSGVRITSTGRRFRIRCATVWNVTDANGSPRGQAVTFREWEYL